MKKTDIEKLLREDLSKSAPDDFRSVQQRIIPREEEKCVEFAVEPAYAAQGADGQTGGERKNPLMRMLALGLAFLLTVSLAVVLIVQLLGGVSKIPAGYLVIDVNPSVEIFYDENGKVTQTEGLNRDGKTLLCDTQLTGKDYREAVEILFERCVRLGYFNSARDNNAVLVSANKNEGGFDDTRTAETQQRFTRLFSDQGMKGMVLTGVEETQALAAAAAAYGVDAQKYALIVAAKGLGVQIDEGEYSSVAVRDLYAWIEEKLEEAEDAEMLETSQQVQVEMEELFEDLAGEIQTLLTGLESVINAGNANDVNSGHRHQLQYEMLFGFTNELEDADTVGECRNLVERILRSLDEMRREEERAHPKNQDIVNLLHQAYGKVQVAFENVNEKISRIDYMGATPEEMDNARKDKFFGSYAPDDTEFDFESRWTEADDEDADDDFFSAWYSVKKDWKEYRANDLH